MNSQIVTVNLVPGLSTPAVVRVSQYDVGRPLVFRVMDGMSMATLPQYWIAKVEGTKPSGLGFSESCTISGSTVTVSTTEAMTQECGQIMTEISFTHTGIVIGTANFILAVEPSPHLDGTTDGTQETIGDLQTQVDDLDERVTALEQGGGGTGLTQEEKDLILELFAKAAYADDDAALSYSELETLWTIITRSVSLNLSHVTSSNQSASVEGGSRYTTTLTADTNYTLNSVSVTMGGVDITSTAYSSGTVSIPSVNGNIVITATAVLAAQSITATYTQSGTVYDTDSLDSLKADLVVTANYSGGTSETVPASAYTLSGTLTEGTSTITVSYAGLTTTFNVTVTHQNVPSGYTEYDYLTQTLAFGTSHSAYTIVADEVTTNSENTIEFTMRYPSGNSDINWNPLLGSRNGASGTFGATAYGSYNQRLAKWNVFGTEKQSNVGKFDLDTVATIKLLPVGKSQTYPENNVIVTNGTEFNTGLSVVNSDALHWFGIFGYAISETSAQTSTTYFRTEQIGEIKIYDANDNVVYDFIPCSDANGKYGYYESVNRNFYCNETYATTAYTGGYWTS